MGPRSKIRTIAHGMVISVQLPTWLKHQSAEETASTRLHVGSCDYIPHARWRLFRKSNNNLTRLPPKQQLSWLRTMKPLLRKKSLLNDIYGGDNASKCRCASTPQYKDWVYWITKTCAIFALLTYNLMLTNYFSNNLYDLPDRPHTPDIDVAFTWCPFVV